MNTGIAITLSIIIILVLVYFFWFRPKKPVPGPPLSRQSRRKAKPPPFTCHVRHIAKWVPTLTTLGRDDEPHSLIPESAGQPSPNSEDGENLRP